MPRHCQRGDNGKSIHFASRVDQTLPKVGAEQQQARVTPKQATPFFRQQLDTIS